MEIYKNKTIENLINEIWVDCFLYEGLYEVSNLGRIKSLSKVVHNNGGVMRRNCQILSQALNGSNPPKVALRHSGKSYTHNVHRLVVNSFMKNKLSSNEKIIHINVVNTDNNINNLKIITKSEFYKINGLKRISKRRGKNYL